MITVYYVRDKRLPLTGRSRLQSSSLAAKVGPSVGFEPGRQKISGVPGYLVTYSKILLLRSSVAMKEKLIDIGNRACKKYLNLVK